MASRRGLVLALLCTILAAVGAWQLGWLATAPPAPAAAPRPSTSPAPRFESAWATEQDWIVATISRDVREMAHSAAGGSVPDDVGPTVRAGALTLEPHIFSPGVYVPLAQEVLSKAGVAARPAALSGAREDTRLLGALLDLRAEVLVRESETVSRQIEAEPGDPGAHERAALLLGAFALREAASRYGDRRPALCRMSAHLAMARALRGDAAAGPAGAFDEALLLTLVGRQRDALSRLDALEAAARTGAERSWVRALRLRNTGDWRVARDAKGLTLLEKIEEFAALATGLGDLEALDWLDRQGTPQPISDWGKILIDAGASVESYNRFAPAAAVAEMMEASEVGQALGRPSPTDVDGLLEALDARPRGLLERDASGRLRPAVLGWGLWADRAQRHLVFALGAEAYHLAGMLGQRGAQKSFVEDARDFSRLELFPLFLRSVALDAELYGRAMGAARELALRAPERITAGCWLLMRAKEDFAAVPPGLPDEKTWFRPALLPGTLLDYEFREALLPELSRQSPEATQALGELAPYDVALAMKRARQRPAGKRSVADLLPVYGPLADYNIYVMGKLTDTAWYDAPEFRRRQGAMCDLVPDKCFLLGYRLAELGFADDAAVAYQKGFDRARDRVRASNESEWLVEYYFARGERAKAEGVARRSAQVGSFAGLRVMARLLERTGRLAEAEKLYRQIYESYDDPLAMTGFYYRQARVAGLSRYEARFREALALKLPSGLEPLDRAALPPKPEDGVVIRKENDNTKRYAIKWGNVIVGFDGFRVRGTDAYDVVRELSYSPRMKLVIWRGQSYDDVEVDLWDRRFRIDIKDLAPKEK